MPDGMSYVARCRVCGAVTAAIVDDVRMRREVSRQVASWIAAGLVVERLTGDEVREQFRPCTCRPPQPRLPGLD